MDGFLKTCLFLAVVFFSNGIHAEEKKKILVVQSYHAANEWDANYKRGLEGKLSSKYDISYFEMDSKRLPKDKVRNNADIAWNQYLLIRPSLVILGDDAALGYLGQRFSETGTPVVFLGVNNNPRAYFKDKRVPVNVTGVLERPFLLRSIVNLRDIMPGIKSVLVLMDDDITSDIIKEEVFLGHDRVNLVGIDVELQTISNYLAWQKSVASAKGKFDACIVGLYMTLKNERQEVVDADEVIHWTSRNAVIPTFAFWDFAVGFEKTIGGTVIYGEEIGETAGELVLQILESGKKPSQLSPVYFNRGRFMFSRKQMEKWHIALPENIASKTSYVE